MKKSSFAAILSGTISGVLFALGMCMALIPEWGAFKPGLALGSAGLLLALIHFLYGGKWSIKSLYVFPERQSCQL